jgi:hypothetical protein
VGLPGRAPPPDAAEDDPGGAKEAEAKLIRVLLFSLPSLAPPLFDGWPWPWLPGRLCEF